MHHLLGKLFILVLCLNSSIWATQDLVFYDFKGKKSVLSFKEMNRRFQSDVIEVMNPASLTLEKYKAISFRKILNHVYGEDQWEKGFGIKTKSTYNYEPLIEVYKFQNREPYLAYAKADGTPFKSYFKDKKKLMNLAPYYLIWVEDYKNTNAARRRHHWPYKVASISLEKDPPVKLIPHVKKGTSEYWGFKNYLKQCFMCHQAYGVGGKSEGEIITNGLTKKFTDKKLALYIGNPVSVNPKSKMPEFPLRIDLRVKRIKDIVAYLRYLEKNDPSKIAKQKKRKFNSKDIDQVLRELKD